jgi:hypothetical protein
VVYTRTHTPLFWGELCNAGVLFFFFGCSRCLRMSWLIVGINPSFNDCSVCRSSLPPKRNGI